MTKVIKVIVVDDLDMHRTMLKQTLRTAASGLDDFDFEVIEECASGKELLKSRNLETCDLITLDIRMPELDGLSTLLQLRKKLFIRTPICMASSEEEGNIDRFLIESSSDKVKGMSFEDKMEHLSKVEKRILAGVTEEGKVNDLLTACEKLLVDPQHYAKQIGANGFLHKPYAPNDMRTTILEIFS